MRPSILTVLICALASAAWADQRPNIVLVMADDHGYGDTGFTGHPFVKTPHLDALAKTGVVFNRFYASAPVCSPTRASVMTGRHPFRVNVPNHGHYLRPHETTVAEALRSAGYVTGHFGKWHIGSVQPDSPTSPGGAGFDEWLSGLNFFDNDPYLSRNGNYEQLEGPGTVISMDATIAFLTKHAKGDKPIFAVTWFPSPHDPQEELPQGMPNAATLYPLCSAISSDEGKTWRHVNDIDNRDAAYPSVTFVGDEALVAYYSRSTKWKRDSENSMYHR